MKIKKKNNVGYKCKRSRCSSGQSKRCDFLEMMELLNTNEWRICQEEKLIEGE